MEFRKELVKYIISTDQLFSQIENVGFGKFMHYLTPEIQMVSRGTLRRDIMKFFQEDKETHKATFMSSRFNVALSSDIWSGNGNMDYISVVVHNIDGACNLKKRLIAFKRIYGNLTIDAILGIFVEVIEEWKLSDKIISITHDNATKAFIDDRRHKPEMIEALTIYKDWCQHERRYQETFINVE